MQLIEHEPHFWELYQSTHAHHQYYLSIAVDMSSVVSCWDLVLTVEEIEDYQDRGKASIDTVAKYCINSAYKGDFSYMESRLASAAEKQLMQASYQAWRISQIQ